MTSTAGTPSMKDRVVIVTGGGSGIGRATSDLFAVNRSKLVLVGRRHEMLEQAAQSARDRGADAITVARDLTEPESAVHVVQRARDEFGSIDVLVNNAGVPGEGVPLHEVSDDLWQEIIDTNLTAAFRMCRAALPVMVEQRQGIVLNVASSAALVAMPRMAVYGAAKAGLLALTRAVAREYGPSDVRCNAVCPGTTATSMTENVFDSSDRNAAVLRGIPLRRVAKPSEIGQAILHLCSSDSSYVNGAVLTVDGGQTSRWKALL